jgi:purine-nucleoside phosphorylase
MLFVNGKGVKSVNVYVDELMDEIALYTFIFLCSLTTSQLP